MKKIKFTLAITKEQNKNLADYQKKYLLENRSQAIRHLIDANLKEDVNNEKQ